jgi:hypothetical protein
MKKQETNKEWIEKYKISIIERIIRIIIKMYRW